MDADQAEHGEVEALVDDLEKRCERLVSRHDVGQWYDAEPPKRHGYRGGEANENLSRGMVHCRRLAQILSINHEEIVYRRFPSRTWFQIRIHQ
jgi:hypothetical protein